MHKNKLKQYLQAGLVALLTATMLGACTIETYDPNEAGIYLGAGEGTVVDYSAIRPEDDFYGYANAGLLSTIDITFYDNDAGAMAKAQKTMTEIEEEELTKIFLSDAEYEKGSKEQILRDVYRQYVEFNEDPNCEARQAVKAEVHSIIDRINSISTISEYMQLRADMVKEYGIESILQLGITMNTYKPGEYCIILSPLVSIGSYDMRTISAWPNSVRNSESKVVSVLKITGKEKEEATEIAKSLARFAVELTMGSDIDILNKWMDGEEGLEQFYTNDQLDEILTNVSRTELEKSFGINSNPYGGWFLIFPEQLKTLNDLLVPENLDALKALALSEFMAKYGSYVTDDYPELENYFVPNQMDMLKQAVQYVSYQPYISEKVADVYLEKTYDDARDRKLRSMVEDVRGGYEKMIAQADWLSQEARDGMLRKLANIIVITGANADHTAIDLETANLIGKNLWETEHNIQIRNVEENLSNIGTAYDREHPKMPMDMVNACYTTDNIVTITAAIAQGEMFDPARDYYENLGYLGMVIAHELGHAFDSNGMNYDEDGAYRPEWISAKDREALEARNQEAIHYFENMFPVFDVYYVDGKQTLGENYADLSAMEVISSLCKNKEQLETLFESYAKLWCELTTDVGLLNQLEDTHSPSIIRVNAILATLDSFIDTYHVQEGDGMYVAPEKRIGRWK